jgi:hypothetical protein
MRAAINSVDWGRLAGLGISLEAVYINGSEMYVSAGRC